LGELIANNIVSLGVSHYNAALTAHIMESICEEMESLHDDLKGFSARMEAKLNVLKKVINGIPMGASSSLKSPNQSLSQGPGVPRS